MLWQLSVLTVKLHWSCQSSCFIQQNLWLVFRKCLVECEPGHCLNLMFFVLASSPSRQMLGYYITHRLQMFPFTSTTSHCWLPSEHSLVIQSDILTASLHKLKLNELNTKVFLLHAMKACRRRRVIAPLILKLSARGDEWSTSYCIHFTPGKNRSTNCIGAIMDVVGMNLWLNERTIEWIYQSTMN